MNQLNRTSSFEEKLIRVSRLSKWVTLLAIVAVGLIALVIAEDDIPSILVAGDLYEVMSTLFPFIPQFVARSSFPSVTSAYMILIMLAFPFALLAPLASLHPDKRVLVPIQKTATRHVPHAQYVKSSLVAIVLLPGLIFFAWFVNPGLDIWFMRFSVSRSSLALFGFFVTLVVPFLIGVFVALTIRMALGLREAFGEFLE